MEILTISNKITLLIESNWTLRARSFAVQCHFNDFLFFVRFAWHAMRSIWQEWCVIYFAIAKRAFVAGQKRRAQMSSSDVMGCTESIYDNYAKRDVKAFISSSLQFSVLESVEWPHSATEPNAIYSFASEQCCAH